MEKANEANVAVAKGRDEGVLENNKVTEQVKFLVVLGYSVLLLLSSFLFNSPSEIVEGMINLTKAPSILVTDYMAVGNVGAAIFNSSLLMVITTLIAKKNKVDFNGPIIAAIFTVGGFALFGKNMYNVWPILLGVLIHAKIKKEKFSKFIIVAYFGTALGPLVSQITFGFDLPMAQAVMYANIAGLIVGLVLPALGAHYVKFHQGFNLYNIGFTAGLVGTFFMAILRSLGFNNPSTLYLAEGYNKILGTYLLIVFASMIILGFIFNNKSFSGYNNLVKRSGRAVTDFVVLDGFGLTLVNMGLLGFITMAYILAVGGQLNGPIIGGIYTVVGFGAFGKHSKNIIPIMIGVYIGALINVWDVNAIGPLLAALFGTTLAPVAGEYGWKFGVLAGFMHMAMVMNVGGLHGGMNLYNNGFSGGIVAALLIPAIDAFMRKEEAA